jgi:glutamyl-tRNA reductase
VLRGRRNQALLMIDLAMPRDIDPGFHNLDGVYLYNLDSLLGIAEKTLTFRKQESEKCYQLIEHHVRDFQLWMERTRSSNFVRFAPSGAQAEMAPTRRLRCG